jgi:hypothetical protein
VSAIDDQIDDLYKQPLSDFISTRNALAKTLSKDDAKRVRALAKPTVVPWAVNQVYWRARSAYDRLMKSGEQLRKAQIAALEGKPADVRAASDAHRRAIADAVGEAERIAASSGSKPSPDALTRTFETLSLAGQPPEAPGRLTEALQPAGFEALAGVTPKNVPGGAKRPALQHHELARPAADTPVRSGRVEADRRDVQKTPALQRRDKEREAREAREREEAAQAARERDTAFRKAEARLARVEAAEQQARAAWERAHDELLAARRTVADLKAHRTT